MQMQGLSYVLSQCLTGKSFLNTIVNEKVAVFNRTISNILNNYIRHENIVCNGRDPQ